MLFAEGELAVAVALGRVAVPGGQSARPRACWTQESALVSLEHVLRSLCAHISVPPALKHPWSPQGHRPSSQVIMLCSVEAQRQHKSLND